MIISRTGNSPGNQFRLSAISLAGKTFLAVINSPVFWYRERDGETADDRRTIARDLAFFALRGAGADDSILEEEFDR